MKRFLLISVILAAMLLAGCAPSQPALAPVKDNSFTIRVTGSQLVWNEEAKKENARHLDEVLAMSKAEYDQYVADGGPAKWAKEHDLFIKSPNVGFSGSYMVVTSSGGSTSRSVDGTTPAEYYIGSAYIVSCSFQKSGEDGTLTVEILKGGKVVSSEYTTADYGVVSVATR